ncbi:MAG: cobyric acid synthase [Ruminococcus sp.]|nr:cobyric acid synthase [Ruminococcus sp.]
MGKSVMIQGTMSNSGKSFISAGLCRIFMQDGYSCAPFKSQNMALNSYVTKEGLEIGRAQAVQAESAGIKPSVLMNPILLKPTTNIGSQVILNGKPFGNMSAGEYFKRKTEFIPHIKNAYEKLSSMHDIIVIEGAGSPVELNLKINDIVNMGMAEMADSPVIIVGDIDRGGIFAQLYGTVSLLNPDERKRVKGLIVNKFRGDISLFDEGVKILENLCGVPVLGVVPYIKCDMEDEDSLSEKLENNKTSYINIAVIKLPKLSNFTDFDVFLQYKGVGVYYAEKPEDLLSADMIVIPGTKNTVADMKYLRESGFEYAVKSAVSKNIPIFGICGGYQILGKKISDPLNSEGGENIDGMGLLDCETVFSDEKKTVLTNGKFKDISGYFSFLSGKSFSGYEIHMGVTENTGNILTDCGGAYKDNVAGCYIHGIFDIVAEDIIKNLFLKKGIEYMGGITDRNKYKNQQLDILAENIRKNIDMKKLYEITGV